MIRDILCDSDCIYQEKGLCEKQNDVSMSLYQKMSSHYGASMELIPDMVICFDYMPRKIKQEAEK